MRVKKVALISAILGVGLLFCVAQPYAYTVDIQSAGAYGTFGAGIQNLTVDGLGTYDVAFRWGSFSSIFGSSNFTFKNDLGDSVLKTINAINNALDASHVYSVGDKDHYLVNGDYYIFQLYTVPSFYDGTTAGGYYIDYIVNNKWSGYAGIQLPLSDVRLYAVITPSAAVPIPGAVWLLGSGLVGLVGLRRKFKK